MILDSIKPHAKAVVGFVAPGVATLVAAVQDGSPGSSNITGAEWIGIIGACIITSGAVYVTPNRDPKAEHQDESVQPPDAGQDHTTVVDPDFIPMQEPGIGD